MEEIIKLDTVGLYNKLYGVETLHPLVSVVDASEIKQDLPANVTLNYGLYALYLKQTKCGTCATVGSYMITKKVR